MDFKANGSYTIMNCQLGTMQYSSFFQIKYRSYFLLGELSTDNVPI